MEVSRKTETIKEIKMKGYMESFDEDLSTAIDVLRRHQYSIDGVKLVFDEVDAEISICKKDLRFNKDTLINLIKEAFKEEIEPAEIEKVCLPDGTEYFVPTSWSMNNIRRMLQKLGECLGVEISPEGKRIGNIWHIESATAI
jgi:hypothetical protein